MKRSCLIIVLMFAVTTAGWANLLVNPSFENGTVNWVTQNAVGSDWWATHLGTNGVDFQGWNPGNGTIQQDVAATNLGAYTFSVYMLAEPGFNPSSVSISLQWKDAATNDCQSAVTTSYSKLPGDLYWHQLRVSGVATAAAMRSVRAVISGTWAAPNPGNSASYIDDADLHQGSFVRVNGLINNSFEDSSMLGQWAGSGWFGGVNKDNGAVQNWIIRTGGKSASFFGWNNGSQGCFVSQPLSPSTGTYTFSFWARAESTNFLWTNIQARIEWYDSTLTNKVAADSVTNIPVSPTNADWQQYYVTGTCTDTNLFEAKPMAGLQWVQNSSGAPNMTGAIDDMLFRPGAFTDPVLVYDWAYHSAVGARANMEQVPGTNVGTFLQVNYNTHTNTFRVMTLNPTIAKNAAFGDGMEVGLRTAWQKPEDGNWMESFVPMTKLGTVEIPSGSAFRGLPASGTATVDLWEVSVMQPTNISGAFYTTNSIRLYYAPYLKATNGVVIVDTQYLVMQDGDLTNNLGQTIASVFFNRDYFVDLLKPTIWAAFTNGGFENPTPIATTLDNTGWFGFGDAGRETWAARSGAAGGVFRTWNPGTFGLYQDVATTGGTYQFAGWLRAQTNATPSLLQMKMQWYDKSGSLVQENSQDLLADLKLEDGEWSRIGVVGSCGATNLEYVRLLLTGVFGTSLGGNTSTMFDDMEFGGVATNLQNVGFETGFLRDIRDWYGEPQFIVMTHEWANHSGSNGAAFHGFDTSQAQYEAKLFQPIAASTGTYIYSVWLKRESNFINMTNNELRLEWYSGSYTGKVQADTVTNITVPNDGVWRQYSLTGTCNNTSLRFVQPVVFAQWAANLVADPRSYMIDDVSLVLTNLSGATYTDGIPDSWLTFYGLGLTNGVGAGDDDGDGYNNLEEYAADTVPTNGASHFPTVANGPGPKSVMLLIVNPSSTARVYDAYWKTNMMDYSTAWQNYGLSVTGNGAAVTLTVTNDLGRDYFRTGAKLP